MAFLKKQPGLSDESEGSLHKGSARGADGLHFSLPSSLDPSAGKICEGQHKEPRETGEDRAYPAGAARVKPYGRKEHGVRVILIRHRRAVA